MHEMDRKESCKDLQYGRQIVSKNDLKMELGVTYIICPDKTCKLFWDPNGLVACDGNCPRESDQRLVIVCHHCWQRITMPEGHRIFQRIDCRNCGAMNFRMSGKYRLRYKLL